jgi:hypothetical protein
VRGRSRSVKLVAVPVLALAFTACGGDDDDTAYCVDESDRIVENQYCDDEATNTSVYPGAFFWYYGGSVAGGRIARGARLTGGDRVASTNIDENVRRGGFGSSSRTSASGIGRATTSGSGGG